MSSSTSATYSTIFLSLGWLNGILANSNFIPKQYYLNGSISRLRFGGYGGWGKVDTTEADFLIYLFFASI